MKKDLLTLAFLVLIAFIVAAVVFVIGERSRQDQGGTPIAKIPATEFPTPSPQGDETPTPTPEVKPAVALTLTPEFTATSTPCVLPAAWVLYTVRPGETLYSIAVWYGMTAEEIQQANCLSFADKILAGQSLYVPWLITPSPTPCAPPAGWVLYTVQPGENFFRIAMRYGMTAEALQQANCLSFANIVQAGQLLYVPYLIPTPPPTKEPELIQGLAEELYFNPGGGGGASDFGYLCFESIPGTELPTIIGHGRLEGTALGGAIHTEDDGVLCLYGIPHDKETIVDLFTPAGELAGSGTFRVEQDKLGTLRTFQDYPELAGSPFIDDPELAGFPIVGSAQVVDGVEIISISIWLPAGLPGGTWHVVARWVGDQTAAPFAVMEPGRAIVNPMPNVSINPFQEYRSSNHSYSSGEEVLFHGTGFEPNSEFPLGLYYLTGEHQGIDYLGVVVHGERVYTDDQGNFSTVVQIDDGFQPGTYMIVTNPGRDGYSDSLSFFMVAEQ